MRTWVFIGFMGVLAAVLTGCRGPSRTPWDNLKETQQKNTELSMRMEALEKENAQLKQQVETLSGLDKETRLQELSTLAAIKLHNRTNLYDKDQDGTPETLVVYLQTLDSQQDYVKTPGRCKIELWDLAAAAAQSKISEWTLEPADLQTRWSGNIFAQYYRIELPLDAQVVDISQTGKELTIRTAFTDLLSGKTLNAQTAFVPPSN